MDHPILRILAALFWTFWFAAVAPAHRRGIIAVDEGPNATPSACCIHTPASDQPQNSKSSLPPSKRCAICMTIAVAGTDAPPRIPPCAPLDICGLVNDSPACSPAQTTVSYAHCRGPPTRHDA